MANSERDGLLKTNAAVVRVPTVIIIISFAITPQTELSIIMQYGVHNNNTFSYVRYSHYILCKMSCLCFAMYDSSSFLPTTKSSLTKGPVFLLSIFLNCLSHNRQKIIINNPKNANFRATVSTRNCTYHYHHIYSAQLSRAHCFFS